MLSPEQKLAYARDGMVVLPGLFSLETCRKLRERAEELVREFQPETLSVFTTREQTRVSDDYFLGSGDKIRCFFEEEAFTDGRLVWPKERAINKIGHALHDLDPLFAAASRAPELAELVRDLGLGDPRLIQSMYIFKQPRIGGEVNAHQDHTFLWTDPPSVVGLWFALEDATVDNGCLWALPGGHREPARQRFCRKPGGGTRFEILDPRPLPSQGFVPLPVAAGTCIVLHGLLPHKSDANRSATSRHAYSIHFIERSAHYPSDNWLQL